MTASIITFSKQAIKKVLTPEGRDNPSVVCQTMFAMTGLQQQGIALWYLTYMRFNSSLKIGGGR